MTSALPEFERPPVVEVACGVQFRPVEKLRGVERFPLYARWRSQLPSVVEQPPLPPFVEPAVQGTIPVQVFFSTTQDIRHWFSDSGGRDLVQLQQDRLIVNWREGEPPASYPRYASVRNALADRLRELDAFVRESDDRKLEITHAEMSYINAVQPDPAGRGVLGDIVNGWPDFTTHHLGSPDAARAVFEFPVGDVGLGARLTASFAPGVRASGESALFIMMTMQGRTDGEDIDAALAFIDSAHDHLVRSFDELTTETLHNLWGKRS